MQEDPKDAYDDGHRYYIEVPPSVSLDPHHLYAGDLLTEALSGVSSHEPTVEQREEHRQNPCERRAFEDSIRDHERQPVVDAAGEHPPSPASKFSARHIPRTVDLSAEASFGFVAPVPTHGVNPRVRQACSASAAV